MSHNSYLDNQKPISMLEKKEGQKALQCVREKFVKQKHTHTLSVQSRNTAEACGLSSKTDASEYFSFFIVCTDISVCLSTHCNEHGLQLQVLYTDTDTSHFSVVNHFLMHAILLMVAW